MENLDFFLDADELVRAGLGPGGVARHQRVLKAMRLHQHYVAQWARQQVNLPSVQARAVEAALAAPDWDYALHGPAELAALGVLAAAQKEVFHMLMRRDSFPPFLAAPPLAAFNKLSLGTSGAHNGLP